MKGFNFIEMVIEAPEAERSGMLDQMVTMSGGKQTLAELEKQLKAALLSGATKRKAAEAKVAREARNVAIEAVTAKVEACREDTLSRDLFDEVAELEGHIVVSGFDMGHMAFTVLGLKVSKRGATGGGKPAANQPRAFVDSDGNRLFGQLPKWAEESVGLEELEELSDEHDIELSYSAKSGKLGSKNLAKLLLKAELIEKRDVTADEQASFEAKD